MKPLRQTLSIIILAFCVLWVMVSCTVRINPDGSKDVTVDPAGAQLITNTIVDRINSK